MMRIILTVREAGMHSWPNAPAQMPSFLRHPHRHTFTVRVELRVTETDRQIEFFVGQQGVRDAIVLLYPDRRDLCRDFGNESCERIATRMLGALGACYPVAAVEVWEDDENGARVEPDR